MAFITSHNSCIGLWNTDLLIMSLLTKDISIVVLRVLIVVHSGLGYLKKKVILVNIAKQHLQAS